MQSLDVWSELMPRQNTLYISVGITNQTSATELNMFVSSPSNLATVPSFTALPQISTSVINSLLTVCSRPTLSTSGAQQQSTTTTTTSVPAATTTATTTRTSTTTIPTSTSTTRATVGSSAGSPTTTTTSTTTTTTTSTNMPPTTTSTTTGKTTTTAPSGTTNPIVFSFATSTSSTTTTKLSLPVAQANPAGVYSNSVFAVKVAGVYYIELCVGITPGTSGVVRVIGGSPAIGFYWNATSQNQVDGNCRVGLMSLTPGVSLTLSVVAGTVYSDAALQTSFTIFSVSDSLAAAIPTTMYALPALTVAPEALITDSYPVMSQTIINPSVSNTYDPQTTTYTCMSSVPHLFVFTVGVTAGQTTAIQIMLAGVAVMPSAQRTSGLNGVTTMSVVALLQCTAGNTASFYIPYGTATNGPANYRLMSVAVVPYIPQYVAATSWALYRTSTVDATIATVDPVTFDTVHVNQGGLYSSSTGVVTIASSGYYYVHISAASTVGMGVVANLVRRTAGGTEAIAFNVYRTSTVSTYYESIGHGAILQLNAGDQLRLVAVQGYILYSDQFTFYTSFVGMLLYYS